jgi:hypothetical protein
MVESVRPLRRLKRSARRRRARVSPALVGMVMLVVSLGGLVFQVTQASGNQGDRTAARDSEGAPGHEREAAAFFDDARQALSHLLASAPQLTGLLAETASGTQPAPAVAGLSQKWADDFATARDLVGRLTPPPGLAWGSEARSLYAMGAALYMEVARVVPRLVAPGKSGERQEALKAARRLELLGERVFDAGHRLLRADGGGDGIVVGRILPAEVPDFALEGLEPSEGASAPPLPAVGGKEPKALAPQDWFARQKGVLAGAVRLIDASVPWLSSPPADPGPARQAAAALEQVSRQLDGPRPAGLAAREGAQDLRLALLVLAESLRTPDSTAVAGDAQLDQTRRLRLIAENLWAPATRMLVSGRAGSLPRYELAPSGLDPAQLRTGGLFNGQPPRLQPGEDPGKDVPGGLPPVDAGMVFRGSQPSSP